MAFESFRAYDDRRPRRLRRIAFSLVAVFHGVLIAAGIAYSYWKVDELTPPTLRVTFMSGLPTPPPPPPPPPAGGGSRPKKVALKPKTPEPVVTKAPEIVQPPDKVRPIKKEFRKHEDEYVEPDNAKPGAGVGKGKIGDEDGEEDGEEGGVKGGKPGGVIGGSIGGAGAAPPIVKMLPPNAGKLQWENCGEPKFPASLRKAGVSYTVIAKICVSKTGVVESVNVLKREDSLLDESVVSWTKACHHRPLTIGSLVVPFCYIQPFEFKGQ